MNTAYRWQGNDFYDRHNNTVLATSDGTTLEVASRRLKLQLPASTGTWELVATDDTDQWVATIKSFTVSRLVVTTPKTTYGLQRSSAFSKQRTIVDAKNRSLGTTRARMNTDLEVELDNGTAIPLPDLAFMTYALTLIDTANRRLKG